MVNSLVSIIIPIYNRASIVIQTLESIIEQNYKNWELIIVDDGSTDKSLEIVESFAKQDTRIKVYKRERIPKGAPTCRNIGFEKSKGDFIIFLDSDDLLAPFCLEQRVTKFIENNEKDFLVFPMLVFHHTMNDDNRLVNVPQRKCDLIRFLRFDYPWITACSIYKRQTLIAVDGFKEGLPFWQDVDLHLRLLIRGFDYKYFDTAQPDSYYRLSSEDSISKGCGFVEKFEILEKRVEIYSNNIKLIEKSLIKSNKELRSTIFSAMNFFAFTYLNTYKDSEKYKETIQETIELLSLNWNSKMLYLLRARIRVITIQHSLLKPLEIIGKLCEALLQCGRQNLFKSTFMKYKFESNVIQRADIVTIPN